MRECLLEVVRTESELQPAVRADCPEAFAVQPQAPGVREGVADRLGREKHAAPRLDDTVQGFEHIQMVGGVVEGLEESTASNPGSSSFIRAKSPCRTSITAPTRAARSVISLTKLASMSIAVT